MKTFEDYSKAVLDEIETGFRNELGAAGRSAFDALAATVEGAEDLREWTEQLASGELTQADFETLVRGLGDLAEMRLLKVKGLQAVRRERLQNALVDGLVKHALSLIA